MRRLALLLAVAIVATGGTGTGIAAPSPSPGGIAVVPDPASPHQNNARNSFRVADLRPGKGFTDAVFVANSTKRALKVTVYAADGIPAQGGGYGYSDRSTRPTDLGAWLRVGASSVTVPAGGRIRVSVSLIVAAAATNGQHVGAVVAEPVDQPVTGPVSSVTRYAMPVVVTVVGGASPKPAVSPTAAPAPAPTGETVRVRDLRPNPHGSRVCPTVRIDNNGGTPARLDATVQSDGWFRSSTSPKTSLDAVPGLTSRIVQLPCVKRPIGPGKLRVTVNGDVITPAHLFWVPLPLLISLLLLLLLIGALITTFVRGLLERRSDDEGDEAAHQARDGDEEAERPAL